MIIDTRKIISITEANQNFSKAVRIADEHGDTVVFKNNRPKYKLVNLESRLSKRVLGQEEAIKALAKSIRSSRVG